MLGLGGGGRAWKPQKGFREAGMGEGVLAGASMPSTCVSPCPPPRCLTSPSHSMESGSGPPSPGPEASLGVKGPEGGTRPWRGHSLGPKLGVRGHLPPTPTPDVETERSRWQVWAGGRCGQVGGVGRCWAGVGRYWAGSRRGRRGQVLGRCGRGWYLQGGRHWVSSRWPTFQKILPRGGGMAKMGALWQEWAGSRSGVKPFGWGFGIIPGLGHPAPEHLGYLGQGGASLG